MTLELVRFGELSQEYREQLEGEEVDPFEAAEFAIVFRSKERHVALRDESGRLAASTGMLEIEIEGAGGRLPVVGIGGVIVRADRRGEGLGRRIVREALAHARTLGPPFALLFCREDRAGFYERLGFFRVRSPVEVEQPDGAVRMPAVTMAFALSSEPPWPEGPISVLSLPF